jgi:nicotinate-nucleotide pyrophosphorylase (carboxylating)
MTVAGPNRGLLTAVRTALHFGCHLSCNASSSARWVEAREVAETGVDFISVGALTHSVKVFDIGMDLRS